MIRAVIDVNVLLSAVLGPLGFPRGVLQGWEAGHFTAVVSEGIYTALEEKLSLPRIVRRYNLQSPDDIRWIQNLLRTQAEVVIIPLAERPAVTGDPEDDYVLATARLGQVDYLVTGDRRLVELGSYEGIRVIRPRAFVEKLLEQQGSQAGAQ